MRFDILKVWYETYDLPDDLRIPDDILAPHVDDKLAQLGYTARKWPLYRPDCVTIEREQGVAEDLTARPSAPSYKRKYFPSPLRALVSGNYSNKHHQRENITSLSRKKHPGVS